MTKKYVWRVKKECEKPSHEFYKASDLLKAGENKKFAKIIAEAYMVTDWICKDYPDHCYHFFNKYIPGIFDGKREIITCYIDNEIAAVAILKKDTERKISTLFVKPEHQKRGIATELLEKCFAWLETTCPVITIADYEKYGWTETEVLADG